MQEINPLTYIVGTKYMKEKCLDIHRLGIYNRCKKLKSTRRWQHESSRNPRRPFKTLHVQQAATLMKQGIADRAVMPDGHPGRLE